MHELRFVIISETGTRGSAIHTLAHEKPHVVTEMGDGHDALTLIATGAGQRRANRA